MALGILCPGQGSQNPGMLDVLKGEPAAQDILDAAGSVLGSDPRQLVAGPPQNLHRNVIAQPLLCAVQVATWVALRGDLPRPRVFAGYSVGELAAYGCADALEVDKLLEAARLRAASMERACAESSGLLAVRGLIRPRIETLCRSHGVEVAIVNDHDRVVVGGLCEALDAFEHAVTTLGASVTRLPVGIASHTSLMAPAVEEFARTLAASDLRDPTIPILAGIDGHPVHTRERAMSTLSRQIAQTVDWASCIDGLSEMGCTLLLELGPCNGLSRMVRDRRPDLPVRSVSEFRSLTGVLAWVGRHIH
ncbi:MAG TPA: malonate decarboxylase subunit epsilon [Azospirillum sp.]|nr:malonate decarboxylase subunit epsilon [Azospirillum sp.]